MDPFELLHRQTLIFARQGDAPKLADCILRGAKTDYRDGEGRGAIHLACRHGRTQTAKILLDAGAGVDWATQSGSTPLMEAAHAGHADCLRLLIDRGADLNRRDFFDESPLSLAAYAGRADALLLLLDAGADPNAACEQGESAIFWAAILGRIECLRHLAHAGAELDQPNLFGQTPLSKASGANQVEAMRALLDLGAASTQSASCDPVQEAARFGALASLVFLDARGFDFRLPDADGNTPLLAAQQFERHECLPFIASAIERQALKDASRAAPSRALARI